MSHYIYWLSSALGWVTISTSQTYQIHTFLRAHFTTFDSRRNDLVLYGVTKDGIVLLIRAQTIAIQLVVQEDSASARDQRFAVVNEVEISSAQATTYARTWLRREECTYGILPGLEISIKTNFRNSKLYKVLRGFDFGNHLGVTTPWNLELPWKKDFGIIKKWRVSRVRELL